MSVQTGMRCPRMQASPPQTPGVFVIRSVVVGIGRAPFAPLSLPSVYRLATEPNLTPYFFHAVRPCFRWRWRLALIRRRFRLVFSLVAGIAPLLSLRFRSRTFRHDRTRGRLLL